MEAQSENGARSHGGARPGAGRKPKRTVYATEVQGLEEAIAVRLSAIGAALIEAALVSAGTRVIEKRRAAGTILIDVPQRDGDGKLILGPNGRVVTVKAPLYPDRDPEEMMLVESTTIVEPPSVSAMRFLTAQVAGRPVTPAEEPELEPDDVFDVLGDIVKGIQRLVQDEEVKRDLLQILVDGAARLAALEGADATDREPLSTDDVVDRLAAEPAAPREPGRSEGIDEWKLGTGGGAALAVPGEPVRAEGGGAADGGVSRADLGAVVSGVEPAVAAVATAPGAVMPGEQGGNSVPPPAAAMSWADLALARVPVGMRGAGGTGGGRQLEQEADGGAGAGRASRARRLPFRPLVPRGRVGR